MTRRKVLVVDDDDGIRAICQLTLEHLGGHEVLALASGRQALEQAAGFAPDLVVLDVSMPVLDGPATLRALREQPALAQVPVVFLTAHADPKDAERLRALGAAGVLTKPFDPAELVERLKGFFR